MRHHAFARMSQHNEALFSMGLLCRMPCDTNYALELKRHLNSMSDIAIS